MISTLVHVKKFMQESDRVSLISLNHEMKKKETSTFFTFPSSSHFNLSEVLGLFRNMQKRMIGASTLDVLSATVISKCLYNNLLKFFVQDNRYKLNQSEFI